MMASTNQKVKYSIRTCHWTQMTYILLLQAKYHNVTLPCLLQLSILIHMWSMYQKYIAIMSQPTLQLARPQTEIESFRLWLCVCFKWHILLLQTKYLDIPFTFLLQLSIIHIWSMNQKYIAIMSQQPLQLARPRIDVESFRLWRCVCFK